MTYSRILDPSECPHQLVRFVHAILVVALVLLEGMECSAQTTGNTPGSLVSRRLVQESIEKEGLVSYPVPSKKDVHPKGWYEAWPKELARIEKLFDDETTSQRIKTMEHWNRFLNYFKMVPDDSSQILAVFMEAYGDDKHYFCAEYAEWIPKLTRGNYAYCLRLFKNEKPVMDEIVRLVIESYDQRLIKQLAEIQRLDQSLRGSISDATDAEEISKILEEQRKLDVANLKAIEKIIAEHGYPGRSLVGVKYEKVAFLVIQHSGGETIGKYLPLLKDAISNKDLEPHTYPYLFDRFEVSNGRPQHFGTQSKLDTKQLFPLYDPSNVNARRNKYGLPPILIEDK